MRKKIKIIIDREENLFSKTLEKGVDRFHKIANKIKSQSTSYFPGEEAFTLYTTYGFPYDLTELMANELGLTINKKEFDEKFDQHKILSENTSFKQEVGVGLSCIPPGELNCAPTDDSYKFQWLNNNFEKAKLLKGDGTKEDFDNCIVRSKILAIWSGKTFLERAEEGETVSIIVDKTCFYAEAGGQSGDRGSLSTASNEKVFEVFDTQKSTSYVLHIGKVTRSTLEVGEEVFPLVNYSRRVGLAQHHSVTHLLNYSLRKELLYSDSNEKREDGAVNNNTNGYGTKNKIKLSDDKPDDIQQRGSLVEENRLRFDFTWEECLDNEMLKKIENNVLQNFINKDITIDVQELPLKQAYKMKGLRAVFGELYPDPVRVVSIGKKIDDIEVMEDTQKYISDFDVDYSVELCGGTHISNTKQLKNFIIISEESVAKGIRRIQALTGDSANIAMQQLAQFQMQVQALKSMDFSTSQFEQSLTETRTSLENTKTISLIIKRELLRDIDLLQKHLLEIQKKRSKELLKLAKTEGENLAKKYKDENFIILELPGLKGDGKALDAAANALKTGAPNLTFLLYTITNESHLFVICVCSKRHEKVINANEWINTSLSALSGKGGGKSDRAIGSAKNVTKQDMNAFKEIANSIAIKSFS